MLHNSIFTLDGCEEECSRLRVPRALTQTKNSNVLSMCYYIQLLSFSIQVNLLKDRVIDIDADMNGKVLENCSRVPIKLHFAETR